MRMRSSTGFLAVVSLIVCGASERGLSCRQNQSPDPIQPTVGILARGDTPSVEVTLAPLDGKVVLRLPELISEGDRRVVYSEDNLRRVNWQRQRNGALTCTWSQAGLAAYQITAQPEADGLLISWIITNLESRDWTSSAGTVCMQSHGVPSLYDPLAERSFVRGGGRWVSVEATWKGPGGNWYLPPGEGPLSIMRSYLGPGGWKITDFHPDEAIMAVRSVDGKWVLAEAWHRARYYIANIHDHYECTDVCPHLGTVAAGETVRVQGKVYFLRGSLEDLESKYKTDLSRKKIDYQHHYK